MDNQDDERQRRVEAMRELAAEDGESGEPAAAQSASPQLPVSQSPISTQPQPPLQRQPSRSRLRWVVAIVVLLAVVIGGVYAATRLTGVGKGNGNATPAASAPAATLRAVGDFTCALPPAWSPDGKSYAVLGAPVPCSELASQPSAEHQAIAVVDATTGAIRRRIAIAPYLANRDLRTCLSVTTECPPVILWSPDGSRLALGLAAAQRNGALSAFALLIIPVNGGAGTVIPGPLPSDAPSSTPPASPYRVFDLTAHTARFLSFSTGLNTADSLTWTADGSLEPSRASSPQPVGNPDGGATFSPWQPAGVAANGANKIDLGSPYPFGAWSPDGRFVTLDLRTHFHVYPGAADATPDTTGAIVGRVSRDAALTAVIADLSAHPDANYMLAWDETGAHLLAVSCASATTATLTIRSTATGAVETTATLSFGGYTTSCQQSTLLPSWSPDGAHILLAAPDLGAAVVWTPKLS